VSETARVRVIYPLQAGRIVLRTEADWNRDVEAARVTTDGTWHEFRLQVAGHWLYFKPVLVDPEGAARWSKGENHLVLAGGDEALDVYPWFFEEASCSVCELMTAAADRDGLEHRYRVFLPAGYTENTLERYPVLYMHDGQNLFFKEEAFLGNTWRTEETLRVLDTMNALEKLIVVGIHPNEREREYTKPGYEAYGRFLVEVLKPRIDAAYRTLAGPQHTAAMGSSLGGVASFHLGWQWPGVFGRVACLSSTFGWRDDLMERVAREPKRDIAIYLDSGWPGDNYEATRAMRDHLIDRGFRPGKDLMYLAFPHSQHNEGAWSARSHIPLQFLFGRTPAARPRTV